jgi:hypothetical protein
VLRNRSFCLLVSYFAQNHFVLILIVLYFNALDKHQTVITAHVEIAETAYPNKAADTNPVTVAASATISAGGHDLYAAEPFKSKAAKAKAAKAAAAELYHPKKQKLGPCIVLHEVQTLKLTKSLIKVSGTRHVVRVFYSATTYLLLSFAYISFRMHW